MTYDEEKLRNSTTADLQSALSKIEFHRKNPELGHPLALVVGAVAEKVIRAELDRRSA